MTVKEAAQKWGKSEEHVRTMCKENKIPNAAKDDLIPRVFLRSCRITGKSEKTQDHDAGSQSAPRTFHY